MRIPAANIPRIVNRYLRAEASASMVLIEILRPTEDPAALARALPTLDGEPAKLCGLARHLAENKAGCCTIVRMIRQRLDSPEVAGDAEDGIERCRKRFDASLAHRKESSVALYCLESPELLAATTDEVIGVLDDWKVLGLHQDALEMGCGIGRWIVSLCSRVCSVVGTDVSSGMICAAMRRLKGFSNTSLQITTGQDLLEFGSGSMELFYSVDAFACMVLSRHALVERHFREFGRVLQTTSDFVLFNYAYGLPCEDANGEVLALAHGAELEVIRADASPFRDCAIASAG